MAACLAGASPSTPTGCAPVPCACVFSSRGLFRACFQTYPIIAAVSAGLVFMTYKLTRATLYNPDVHWDKTARSTQFYRDEKEAEAWGEAMRAHSRWNRPGLDVGQVSVFESWFKPAKQDGSAKVFGPAPPKA